MLDNRDLVSYPDGGQLQDGTIVVSYDRDRRGAGEILLARFTEEDILAGHLASPGSALRLPVVHAGAAPGSAN